MNSFSCSPLNASFMSEKTWKRLPENSEYAEIKHGDVTLTLQCRQGSKCGQRAAVNFNLALGLVWVCEIEIFHIGKNIGNPDLVCKK